LDRTYCQNDLRKARKLTHAKNNFYVQSGTTRWCDLWIELKSFFQVSIAMPILIDVKPQIDSRKFAINHLRGNLCVRRGNILLLSSFPVRSRANSLHLAQRLIFISAVRSSLSKERRYDEPVAAEDRDGRSQSRLPPDFGKLII
jgi:hypothetical protein